MKIVINSFVTNILIKGLLLIVMLSSCTQRKHLVYFNKPQVDSSLYISKAPLYKIQNQDVLYVKVFSLALQENDLYNIMPSQSQGTAMQSDAGLYINGYAVNDSGCIVLPVMGQVKVVGKTIDQAQQEIYERLKHYFKDATVIVKLLSFKVSVLGEVARPGVYRNYNTQLTILEALSMAGDINQYGSRRNVMIIRTTPEGNQTYRINLTDPGILGSQGFYLQPNDYILVNPLKQKTWGTGKTGIESLSTIITILSLATTTFLLLKN